MMSVPVPQVSLQDIGHADTEVHVTSVLPAHGGLLTASGMDPTPILPHEDDGAGTERCRTERYRTFHAQQSTVLIYAKKEMAS